MLGKPGVALHSKVDSSITRDTIASVWRAGCGHFVAGYAIFQAGPRLGIAGGCAASAWETVENLGPSSSPIIIGDTCGALLTDLHRKSACSATKLAPLRLSGASTDIYNADTRFHSRARRYKGDVVLIVSGRRREPAPLPRRDTEHRRFTKLAPKGLKVPAVSVDDPGTDKQIRGS